MDGEAIAFFMATPPSTTICSADVVAPSEETACGMSSSVPPGARLRTLSVAAPLGPRSSFARFHELAPVVRSILISLPAA